MVAPLVPQANYVLYMEVERKWWESGLSSTVEDIAAALGPFLCKEKRECNAPKARLHDAYLSSSIAPNPLLWYAFLPLQPSLLPGMVCRSDLPYQSSYWLPNVIYKHTGGGWIPSDGSSGFARSALCLGQAGQGRGWTQPVSSLIASIATVSQYLPQGQAEAGPGQGSCKSFWMNEWMEISFFNWTNE